DGHRAIVPGKPLASSLYLRLVSQDEDERMPPPDSGRKLTAEQIELVRLWIEQGAKWEQHWSFVSPKRPATPTVRNKKWVRNPIDAFVLARIEQAGLSPSPEASKETLIRRLTLDLTGLPPTLEEIDAFLADKSPAAYESLVDRLLRSPRFGEHMAATWLDAARYGDTNGYQSDGTRTMWPWRDWVIDALNKNMPFDQFTVEQIAGDLLPGAKPRQILATGFNRNHPLNGEGGRIAEESRVDYVVDRVETTGTVWLGLSIGCGRCHDHKFDPISQREFYGLYAYFNSIDESGGVDRGGNAKPVMKIAAPQIAARIAELEKKIAGMKVKGAKPQAASLAGLQKELDRLKKSIPETMVMGDRKTPRETFVLIRGQYDKPDKSQRVSPGVPASLHPLPADAPKNRLALARWLVDPANPLTARVTVNRTWQQIFGVGLVRTSEEFGSQGERPTHPQLLDYLATELVSGGWDVKKLLRLIVSSATYRQSSRTTPELLQNDPTNRLLARSPRYRLSSFAIRDQALALGGLLVERIGGPPVRPYQPADVWSDFSLGKIKYKQDHGESLYRRSLYTFWRRSVGPTIFFDVTDRQVCSVRPSRTNTPLHSLTLLNDITHVEAARKFAERVMSEGDKQPQTRLNRAFRMATARRPTAEEAKILLAALDRLTQQFRADAEAAKKLLAVGESPASDKLDAVELAAFAGVMNMLLNLDEVITRE
ncbi:MAG: PSD1 domain-containing protein, partial [Planctomycetes bacterium]|nr:PSD1 domain-containing protein [Planctomycetota bacterium]